MTAPFQGRFRLYLRPDGIVVAPDLAEPLIPLLRAAGADESLWQRQPCAAATPVLLATRRLTAGIARGCLAEASESELWGLHAAAMGRLFMPVEERVTLPEPDAASLLELKIELARRLLAPCLLCERRCGVDRRQGETGFCGLGAGLQTATHAMLYNEGPLVGAPTFSVFVRGCSLRCSFCYRPDELRARGGAEADPLGLARLLDQAAERGAESWHFLGGNPDESLPGILQALAATTRYCPVVWNSALMLTPSALALLKGVVDIWLPDYKFGNDDCARRVAGFEGYGAVLRRNLGLLSDQPFVVVRHMEMPGHQECCTARVEQYVRQRHPGFGWHRFPQHEPPRPSVQEPSARPIC